MKKYDLIPALVWAVALFATVQGGGAQTPAAQPVSKSEKPPASKHERFDDLVRDDFFSGKPELFDRAMKLCERTLATNSTHAQAMVWHGSGLVAMASRAFQSNDIPRGIDLWRRGLREMDKAVELEPGNVAVLIPRGATLLPVSRYTPDKEESKRLLKTGVADYEKVLELQKEIFGTLSSHARGELLFGLADGWYRLDDSKKSREYLHRITKDCAGSKHAEAAASWLATTNPGELAKKSASLNCIGCHDR